MRLDLNKANVCGEVKTNDGRLPREINTYITGICKRWREGDESGLITDPWKDVELCATK